MLRLILSSSFTLLLLIGCANQSTPVSTSSTTGLSATSYMYIDEPSANPNHSYQVYSMKHDPDGDGDTKGYNHFPTRRKATGNKMFIFDPHYGAWAAYDAKGNRVNTGRASGGKSYCEDINRGCKTVSGRFRVIAKGGPDCISRRFPIETNGGAPMPYCMHFTQSGYAIHGSYDVPDHNASHGCVRITPTVAKWLNENFMNIGTTVIVLPY